MSPFYAPVPMIPASVRSPATGRRDALWLTLGLLVVLAWDASGLDLAAARPFAGASGFALQSQPVLFYGLHELPRMAGWALLAALFASIRWPFGVLRQLARSERAWLASTVLASVVAISLLKGSSSTSCPWDLAQFGGRLPYVSHWALGMADGGGGHCFPAGHASAAFAWVAGFFAFRGCNPRVARAWLVAAVSLGFLLGLAQQARGAHFMSHTLWTGWICWSVAFAADRLRAIVRGARSAWPGKESVHGHA